ncbi:hypothetical protein JOB18_041296 [Solea senegalensis]|uniref:Uncharacterized protein n=1 Tax=Solea senegalensis TaxID=28829 RepID=A0AAV6QZR7_SOLSE|nr:hypothetical protein JOB18_041296 [Solea senegalensis]
MSPRTAAGLSVSPGSTKKFSIATEYAMGVKNRFVYTMHVRVFPWLLTDTTFDEQRQSSPCLLRHSHTLLWGLCRADNAAEANVAAGHGNRMFPQTPCGLSASRCLEPSPVHASFTFLVTLF